MELKLFSLYRGYCVWPYLWHSEIVTFNVPQSLVNRLWQCDKILYFCKWYTISYTLCDITILTGSHKVIPFVRIHLFIKTIISFRSENFLTLSWAICLAFSGSHASSFLYASSSSSEGANSWIHKVNELYILAINENSFASSLISDYIYSKYFAISKIIFINCIFINHLTVNENCTSKYKQKFVLNSQSRKTSKVTT